MRRETVEQQLPWLVEAGRRLPGPAHALAGRVVRRASVGVRVPFRWGGLRRTSPINRHYGYGRGTPVDRWYIATFMRANAVRFNGRVLELQNTEWTKQLGEGASGVEVLDIDPTNEDATMICDLDEVGSLPTDEFDLIVAPQTLQYVRNPRVVLNNLWRATRPGGSILLTVPTVSKLDPTCGADGDLWRFTPAGLRVLLTDALPQAGVTVEGFGNVLAATAFLQGIAAEELTPAELAHHDDEFPLVACARVSR